MGHLARLPLDVLDIVLRSLPDFTSLRATASSCKSINRAYTARPASVKKAVLFNLAPSDAVLTLALRAVRVWLERGDEDQYDSLAGLQETLELNTEANAFEDPPITWPEAIALEDRIRTCEWVEVLFRRE